MSNLRAIYLLPLSSLWAEVAKRLQEKAGYESVLTVGEPKVLQKTVFSNGIIYPVECARRGDWCEGLPIPKNPGLEMEVIKKLSAREAVVYDLMERSVFGQIGNCTHSGVGYRSKQRFYRKLVGLWCALLDTLSPDVVISASAPHRVFDYILSMLCGIRSLPFLYPENVQIPKQFFFNFYDFGPGSINCRSSSTPDAFHNQSLVELNKSTADWLGKKQGQYLDSIEPPLSVNSFFSSNKILDRTKTNNLDNVLFLKNQFSWRRLSLYFSTICRCMISIIRRRQLAHLLEIQSKTSSGDLNIRPRKQYKHEIRYLRVVRDLARTEKWYLKNIVEPDFDLPFIYFPASYQRERSTNPDADIFFDYGLLLDLVDKCLPKGWVIYYREHPSTFGRWPPMYDNGRSIEMYSRIERTCDNVKFISTRSDPFKLIDSCRALLAAKSLSNSILEALVRGKPVVYGTTGVLSGFPGMFDVGTKLKCVDAFEKIEKGVGLTDQELQYGLKQIENNCTDLSSYFLDNMRIRQSTGSNRKWVSDDVDRMTNAIVTAYNGYIQRARQI